MKTEEFPPIRHSNILFFFCTVFHLLVFIFPIFLFLTVSLVISSRCPNMHPQLLLSLAVLLQGQLLRCYYSLLLFSFIHSFFFFTPLDNVFTATRNVCQGQPEKHLDFEQVHLTAVKRKNKKKGPVPVHINLFLRATLWLKSSASSRFPRQQNFSGVSFIALALNPD